MHDPDEIATKTTDLPVTKLINTIVIYTDGELYMEMDIKN
jgi:hypothetical protein